MVSSFFRLDAQAIDITIVCVPQVLQKRPRRDIFRHQGNFERSCARTVKFLTALQGGSDYIPEEMTHLKTQSKYFMHFVLKFPCRNNY